MKIISGGQTGADRAGLDVALKLNIPCGGCCPQGRLAEDGAIPSHYPLQELNSRDYRVRTKKNAVDSQATVIFSYGKLRGGSLLTKDICIKYDKPCLHIDASIYSVEDAADRLQEFIANHFVTVLNVAGQRLSGEPRIYQYTYNTLAYYFDQAD